MQTHDFVSEAALLGAAMGKPDLAAPALLSVPTRAWYDPKHQALAAVITDMVNRGEQVDPNTVLSQVMAQGLIGKLDGPWILSLYQMPFVAEMADEYAKRIRSAAAHRDAHSAGVRYLKRLEWDSSYATGDWLQAIDEFETAAADARAAVTVSTAPPPPSLADLLETEDTYDWLIPGLLERGERFVLTGGEGIGKSVLASQIAACLAGGLHPFTGEPLGSRGWSVRVLIADAENNERQTRRRYRRIVKAVNEIRESYALPAVDWRDVMRVALRPEGIDLLSSRDVVWLEQAVQATSPELLVLGPLYRLHHKNESDGEAAREVQHVIDGLRARHGVALLTEAHAGHAQDMATGNRLMRPAGSSAWLRWPEFGYGLRRSREDDGGEHPNVVDVVAWRGSREERCWPQKLVRGRDGLLPWRPSHEYYADLGDYTGAVEAMVDERRAA